MIRIIKKYKNSNYKIKKMKWNEKSKTSKKVQNEHKNITSNEKRKASIKHVTWILILIYTAFNK